MWQAYQSLGVDSLKLIQNMNQTPEKGLIFLANETHDYPIDIWTNAATNIKSGWESFLGWMGDPFGLTSKILTLLHIMVTLYILYRLHSILTAIAMMKVTTALTWSRIPTTQVQNRLLMTIPARISVPTGENFGGIDPSSLLDLANAKSPTQSSEDGI